MIPSTLYQIFTARWLDVSKAPLDAPDWLAQGFLMLVSQGKRVGYAIAPPGYALMVDGRR